MNRDLVDYQEQYSNQPYEKYQVAFRKQKLMNILSKYSHANLLEVGCGLESIFLDFTSYRKLTVAEPAEMFYLKALEDLKTAKNKNVALVNELLQDCQSAFENERFDFILVSSLLHEIPNQIGFFKTLNNISTSDTVIHINVPNAKSFHRLLAVEMGLIESVYEMSSSNIQFQQHEVFDLERLRELVENNGFNVIDSGSYSFKPFTHSQMQNMVDNGSITEKMLDGFFNMENYLGDIGSEIYVNIKQK